MLCLGAISARGDTLVSWIGPTGTGGNGNWSTAADWSRGLVPNNSGTNTYSVTLPTYSNPYTVTLDMSPTIDNLTIDSTAYFSATSAETLYASSLTNAGVVGSAPLNLVVTGNVSNSAYIAVSSPAAGGSISNVADGFFSARRLDSSRYVQTGEFSQGSFFTGGVGKINGGYLVQLAWFQVHKVIKFQAAIIWA